MATCTGAWRDELRPNLTIHVVIVSRRVQTHWVRRCADGVARLPPLSLAHICRSIESGYGNDCAASSNIVPLADIPLGTCYSLGFDGYGVGITVKCAWRIFFCLCSLR